MKKLYSLRNKDIETEELQTMLAKYPQAAQYLPFYLFAMTYEQVTGFAPLEVVDLSGYVFIESVEDRTAANQITKAEFDAQCDALLNEEFTGKEIILSVEQGKYLHHSRYPNEETI